MGGRISSSAKYEFRLKSVRVSLMFAITHVQVSLLSENNSKINKTSALFKSIQTCTTESTLHMQIATLSLEN